MFDFMELSEKGKMPDSAIRAGIRKLLRDRLRMEARGSLDELLEQQYRFIDEMNKAPIAIATEDANEQHYEVPSEFFQTFMGPHLKYSCGYWPMPNTSLAESEEAMLEITLKRAGLKDGMDILELGCGWGSLSIWMAAKYPNSNITVVSNSRTQKKYIDARHLPNLEVITEDINTFRTEKKYDRVISVEMFEHMRNWNELLRRINGWLNDDGQLFIHIFVNRHLSYLFNDAGENNWMAEHFFKEGMMPSESMLSMLNEHMIVSRSWRINGRHYARTLRAWLDRFDQNKLGATAILERQYSKEEVLIHIGRWRIFFMACEELFAFKGGEEWYVAHYLLKKR